MPTNLNALIRYKTIDRCLQNRNIRCTIDRLQEECSEALGEKRGIYKKVSERTIRDDIRVMRSDILGFNAPIIFENGYYAYSDSNYSIFQEYMLNKETISAIYHLILENRHELNNELIYTTLSMLAEELGKSLPRAVYLEREKFNKLKRDQALKAAKSTAPHSTGDDSEEISSGDIKFMMSNFQRDAEEIPSITESELFPGLSSKELKKIDTKLFAWKDILQLLD